MGSRRLTRTEYDGTITVAGDSFDGKRPDRPERRGCQIDDSILVSATTAPVSAEIISAQSTAGTAVPRYRLDPKDEGDYGRGRRYETAEGLAFSPDEKLLYVIDTPGPGQRTIQVYDVAPKTAPRRPPARVQQRRAGRQRWHAGRHRRQSVVRLSGGEAEDGVVVIAPDGKTMTHHGCRNALRQRLFRWPEAQSYCS